LESGLRKRGEAIPAVEKKKAASFYNSKEVLHVKTCLIVREKQRNGRRGRRKTIPANKKKYQRKKRGKGKIRHAFVNQIVEGGEGIGRY